MLGRSAGKGNGEPDDGKTRFCSIARDILWQVSNSTVSRIDWI
jgi:hypothetical protein